MNKLIASFISLFLISAAHAQVTFSVNKPAYQTGETITATWAGRTGGFTRDWIAVYPRGITPSGSPGSTIWNYLSGTKTRPASAIAAGSINFTNPNLANGNWTAFFLANDGYSILGRMDFSVTASGSSRTLTSFTLNKTDYRVGETLSASWTGLSSPAGSDWIGIYPRNMSGVPDGSPISTIWYYLNNTRTATTGAASGTVNFTNPGLPAGEWRAYFLLNDGYLSLGTVDFTVFIPSILAFGADHQFIDDSPVITLSWALNPSATVQSLTINDGAATTSVLGQDTLDVTPSSNTTYTLALNGTTTATAQVFKNASQSAAFALNSDVTETANGITVSWDDSTVTSDTWVGIYKMGDTPGPVESTQWNYVNGTKVALGAFPTGSLSFGSLPAGEYFAMLFGNSGFDLVRQGPLKFSVANGPFKPLAVTRSEMDAGDFRIDWDSKPTKKYDLEVSTDMITWTALKRDWKAVSTSSTLYASPTPGTPGEFYRLREK